MYRPNLNFVALLVPEIIAKFWVGLRTPNLGEKGRRGSGISRNGTVRKSVGEFL